MGRYFSLYASISINGAKTFHIGVIILGMPYSLFRFSAMLASCQP